MESQRPDASSAFTLPPESAAPWPQISIAPLPVWVKPLVYDRSLPAREGDHLSYLAWERHVNLTSEMSFHATAVRLETALAVQHQSQWRLNVDLRFHRLKLHWLRVVRGVEASDHLRRDRMRLIQRETQLEHLVIDGQWTLLIVLPDVRVGDIIEAGYSFEGRDPVRPGGCDLFFMVPSPFSVGRYRLRLEFDEFRSGLNYRASTDAPNRTVEQLDGGRVRWNWEGQQTILREPEPYQPTTHLDYVWVQISDLADWRALATCFAELWAKQSDDVGLNQFPGLARPAVVDETTIHQFIRYVQDEFRYLSVDLENGGWIPARPSAVAQRRYGDCKDLAWFATSLLRSWGVATRPILVGTGLGERVQTMQPMAQLFNHAVIEVEFKGAARWFDLTMRHQGGDFHSQPAPWYGCGLPVEANAPLRIQPGPRSHGLYAIRETIYLDTRREEKTIVEVRVWAEGWNADHLRRTRFTQGTEEFAKERLASVRRRYGKGERLGTVQWRDNRTRNVCELAEAFEIPDATYPDESGKRALFDVPPNILLQTFIVPEQKKRRSPWSLAHRMEIRHEICIRSPSCGAGSTRRRRWECLEFGASMEEPRHEGVWKKIMRFELKADEVPVERIAEYRAILERFLQATSWRLYLPPKVGRIVDASEVGALPQQTEGINAYVPSIDARHFENATNTPLETAAAPKTPSPGVFAPGRSDNHVWRFAIPVAAAVAMALARSCSTENSPRDYSSLSSHPNPSASTTPLLSNLLDRADIPLPPGPVVQGEVYRDGRSLDALAEPISRQLPNFPPALQAIKLDGEVLIEFVVTDQGVPTQISVVTETHPAFGRAASIAVAKWRFRPAMKAGKPVNLLMRVPILFRHDLKTPPKSVFDEHLPSLSPTLQSDGVDTLNLPTNQPLK